ncbi:MAG TPA: efflux transporter outer membrane subunit [Mariprofundaceae bacterium]|nr:efflux transporter outer membrane subunit [Mariprofundaceae bacterium]
MSIRTGAVVVVAATLLSGCMLGPDYQRSGFTYQESWHTELATPKEMREPASTTWWSQFNDPTLNSLIEQASRNNLDLAMALANVQQARALRRTISADYFPQVDASAGANRSRYSRQTGFGSNIGTRNNFNASLDASWELDLFGRVRRSVEAADARIEAEEALLHGVQLTVLAETATAYFELRSLQAQQGNIEQTIELMQEIENIAQAQFDAGIISELDLFSARGERENLEAQLPNLQADITARAFRLSVLTGKEPEYHVSLLDSTSLLPQPKDRVPLGLRSELLQRRPDIRQAERLLAASTADIGVAKADLFPSFSLTGAIGSSARAFGDLFTAGTITSSVGGALGWPIFSGGKTLAEVDGAKASQRAALANYRQQVLLALEDTENALLRYGQEWKTLNQLQKVRVSREQAFEIARLRYEAGEESFLNALNAQRNLNATRNDLILSQTRVLTNLTTLYKALGGEWHISE